MASPTTTLPSATLAALDGGTAHALAGKRLFRNTVWSGIGSAAPILAMKHHLLPKTIYLAGTTGITAVLAIPLMKRAPALVEA